MFPELFSAGASLLGGAGKGGGAGGPIKQSQDGNTITSGTGEFNFGGSKVPGWIWPVGLGVAVVVGLLIWKPWKT